jgi:hypothetical protein
LLPKNGLKNTLAKSKGKKIEKQNFIEEPITQTLKTTYKIKYSDSMLVASYRTPSMKPGMPVF